MLVRGPVDFREKLVMRKGIEGFTFLFEGRNREDYSHSFSFRAIINCDFLSLYIIYCRRKPIRFVFFRIVMKEEHLHTAKRGLNNGIIRYVYRLFHFGS